MTPIGLPALNTYSSEAPGEETVGTAPNRVGAVPPIVSTGPRSVSCDAAAKSSSAGSSGAAVDSCAVESAAGSSGSGSGVGETGAVAACVSAMRAAFSASAAAIAAATRRLSRSAAIKGGSMNAVYSRVTRPDAQINSSSRSITGSLMGPAEVILTIGCPSSSVLRVTASSETMSV